MKDRWRPDNRVIAPVKNLAHRFAYLGLVLATVALMMLGKADIVLMERARTHVTDALAPILDVLSRPIATASHVVDETRELIDLRAENARLLEERERLLHWHTVARRLDAENQTLRGLLNFQPGPDTRFITARVIADAGGAFAHSMVVNAGAPDRVGKGQAVVTGEGLVGRVHSVGARSARILLITDLNSRIPVLVEPGNTRAILAGDNSDQPRLIHLPPGASVSPGDRIVSSGHGGAFPPRLSVGVVASVSDGGIKVQPFVERNRVEYVRIVDFGLRGILDLPQVPASAGTEKEQ